MVVLEGYKEERMSEAIAEWELLVVVVLGLVMRMPSIVAEPPLGWEIEMVGARVPVGMRVLGEEVGGVRGEGTWAKARSNRWCWHWSFCFGWNLILS
jgi:hypothetical protein